jgi:hypothetical protein
MDLYNANAAYSLHNQDARRVSMELEHLRVARERAIENAAGRTGTAAVPHRRRGFSLAAIFRGRAHTAH